MSPATFAPVPETADVPTKSVIACEALSAEGAPIIARHTLSVEKLDAAFGDYVGMVQWDPVVSFFFFHIVLPLL